MLAFIRQDTTNWHGRLFQIVTWDIFLHNFPNVDFLIEVSSWNAKSSDLIGRFLKAEPAGFGRFKFNDIPKPETMKEFFPNKDKICYTLIERIFSSLTEHLTKGPIQNQGLSSRKTHPWLEKKSIF